MARYIQVLHMDKIVAYISMAHFLYHLLAFILQITNIGII